MSKNVRLKELRKGSDNEKVKSMGREFTVENVMDERWVVDVPMVHDDVRCVGCTTKPIVGKRFECDLCFAYNLCEDCFNGKNKTRPYLNYQMTIVDQVEKNDQEPLETYLSDLRSRRKQDHKPNHSFTDVINDDTDWSRALRLKKDRVFRTLIGEEEEARRRALNWVMNKERSTQKVASYLLDMKEEDSEDHFITNSVLNLSDGRNNTVLTKALRNGWGDVTLTLIKRKVDMDRKETLIKALMNNLTQVAAHILNLRHEVTGHYRLTKEDMNSVHPDHSILIWTIRNKMAAEAISLVGRGADWDVEDRKAMTPLMWACKTNQPSVVEKLLQRTTEEHINKRNQEKMTALAIAVANKNNECIKHIMRSGVSVNMYCHIKDKLLPFSYKNIKDLLNSQIDKVNPHWGASDENGGEYQMEDENMIEFNYSNIVNETSAELTVINDFVHLRKENMTLLKHPLLEAMIMMKWRKFQWLWLIMLVLQLLFTLFMFKIGVLLYKYQPDNCGNTTVAEFNSTEVSEDRLNQDPETGNITILALILWVFYVLVEVTQFSISMIEVVENMKTWWRRVLVEIKKVKISKIILNFNLPIPTYLKETENWLQVLIIVLSGWLLVIVLNGSVREECNTARELMSYLYPLMYLEVMCVLGTHPAFKIYISLFWGVLKSYIGYLLIYGLFLLCFAVGYLQMFEKAEEPDEKMAWPAEFLFLLLHVFNMFLGTLELASIKWADSEQGYTMKVQIIYVFIFAVLIMLTLLNLLNALAIEDVNRMIEKSATEKLYTILCLVHFWEERFRKLSSPSRILEKICKINNATHTADSYLGDWFKVLEKGNKKLYFKAYQNTEVKFSLINIATFGLRNCKTLEGYTSPSEGNLSGFAIPKRLADHAIEIFHERTNKELVKEEKNERNLFFEKVLSNTLTIKKATEDIDDKWSANMEKVIKTSADDKDDLINRIEKIESDISTILDLLRNK